jgi:hypothetical protein
MHRPDDRLLLWAMTDSPEDRGYTPGKDARDILVILAVFAFLILAVFAFLAVCFAIAV